MKRMTRLLIVMLLLLCFPVIVKAHPGRTDSRGGHTNHSTGEYHYHHGYSAHDHYDMDGDGNVDCPYDFKDKTNSSSKGNNAADDNSNSVTPETTDEKVAQNSSLWEFLLNVCVAVVIGSFILARIFLVFDENAAAVLFNVSFWSFGILIAVVIFSIALGN